MNRQQRRANLSAARKRQDWSWEERAISSEDLARYPSLARMKRAYVNDLYSVQVYDVETAIGPVLHLIVRSHDGVTEPPWRNLQRIKNELLGKELEAVQVYPKQSDLMDQANVYHLWVLPAAYPLPFGLHRESGFTPREGV